MNLDILQIAQWTKGIISHVDQQQGRDGMSLDAAVAASIVATGYSIDSRTLQPGDAFFAIHGSHFDGHDFVEAALHRGASLAVIAEKRAADLLPITRAHTVLLVADPLLALQELAAAVRRHWGKLVVAITGSAGKTTTKEAVATVLASRFQVLKSLGNFNNGFGLPLQLLRLSPEHDFAVLELGMSHPGEIAALARIAAPDWGVITNVGAAHAENFPDGIAGIARAKFELLASLTPGSTAFLNCDDPYVSRFSADFHGHTVFFGTGPCAGSSPGSPRAHQIEELGEEGIRFRVSIAEQEASVTLAMLGRHNVLNACAGIAVGLQAGISLQQCATAVSTLRPPDKRGEILCIRGATIINDSYNSNPAALKSMIDALGAMPRKRKILIAGEMLELGPLAAEMHREAGKAAVEARIDIVIGVRGNAIHLVEAARSGGVHAVFFKTPQEAGSWLAANLRAKDAVLIKASRGVRLEQALDALSPVLLTDPESSTSKTASTAL